jgi:hypothetical protein
MGAGDGYAGSDRHRFPRTYHLWSCNDPRSLARYDMVVGYASCDLATMRARNQRGIFLLNPGLRPRSAVDYRGVGVSYGGIDQWSGGRDRLRGGVDLGWIRPFRPYWDYLHNADGSVARVNSTYGHPGWNLGAPAGRGTPTMVAKVYAYAAKLSGLYRRSWNGVHSDGYDFVSLGHSLTYGPNLDTNRDGIPDDPRVRNRRYADGLARVGNLLRKYLPRKTVGGNGHATGSDRYPGSDPDGWLKSGNYTLVEGLGSYSARRFISLARRWLRYPDPYARVRYFATIHYAPISVPSGASPNQNAYMLNPEVLRTMRWGLTLSLMAGAYYEILPYDLHGALWWYDEYDGGRGVRRRGYLGHALGPARKLTNGLWRRDFEHGIALHNSTSTARTTRFARRFRHLRGYQNPQLNDGSLTRRITVPGRDGVILLRTR